MNKKRTVRRAVAAIAVVVAAGILAAGYFFFVRPVQLKKIAEQKLVVAGSEDLFGWKYPVAMFPETGSEDRFLAYSSIRDPGGIPVGLPVRLKIPSIGVDTAIEDAYITSDGRMDVPAGSLNVAWFSLGPPPGKKGSSVIGGHFGIENGVPFVFYNLDRLKIGNKVYIENDLGETLAFEVRSIKSFERNDDATTVFTSNDGLAHLNLITCEGVWNRVNNTYPQRLVVFTDQIPSEGSVEVEKATPAPVPSEAPLLPTTAQGGTESPTTLVPDESPPSGSPLPDSDVELEGPEETVPYAVQMVRTVVGTFYGSLVDGAVTSLLLLTIVFLVIKYIRK